MICYKDTCSRGKVSEFLKETIKSSYLSHRFTITATMKPYNHKE